MAKTTKKRTKTKDIPRKKKSMNAADMKKVKGGISMNFEEIKTAKVTEEGLLLPAVQKVQKV